MKVTEKDVTYVADLANLELSGEERVGMVRDLNSILDYIEMLKCRANGASIGPLWRRPIEAGKREIRLCESRRRD
jgi:hypothetical protein